MEWKQYCVWNSLDVFIFYPYVIQGLNSLDRGLINILLLMQLERIHIMHTHTNAHYVKYLHVVGSFFFCTLGIKIHIFVCTFLSSLFPIAKRFLFFLFLSIFTYTCNNKQDPGPAWMTATTVNKSRDKGQQVRRRKLWI